MTSPVLDETVLPLAELLLECLRVEVASVPDPPKLVMLRPGQRIDLLLSTLEDECCQGLAWVRPGRRYPSTDFPIPDTAASNCGPVQWAIPLEMGVARCAPRPAANQLPSADAWTAVTEATLHDDAAMIRAVVCCFGDVEQDRMYVFGPADSLPVDGGCVGGTRQVIVAALACDCPDPAETS